MDTKEEWGDNPYRMCPKCGYTRTPSDPGPVGQCPQCQIVYSKYTDDDLSPRPVAPFTGSAVTRRPAVASEHAPPASGSGVKLLFTVVIIAAVLACGYFGMTFYDEMQASPDDIIIFTGDGCVHCEDAVLFLEDEGVDFVEYNVTDSIENMKKFKKMKTQALPLLIIGKKRIRGFDREYVKEKIDAIYEEVDVEEEEEEEEDDEAVRSTVVLYTSVDCDACEMARDYFKEHDIEYTEYDIADPESHEIFEELGGREGPYIIIGKNRIRGFDEESVRIALEQKGLL
ncbi:MAG: glutaredoxin family protein [Desulfobacterales bacterium]|nr:glutaredoxin family protein [Desulfobacterales bacterium]